MSNLISADNGTFSNTAGIKLTSDTSGAFEIKTGNNVTAVTLSAQQNATFANNIILNTGTANGVSYLNASKVLTTGNGLVFDGTNLGIGPASPQYKLDVAGAVGDIAAFRQAIVVTKFGTTNLGQGEVYQDAYPVASPSLKSAFIWRQGSSESMRLDMSGNLGIGNSSPSAKLDVTGSATISGTVTGTRLISNIATGTAPLAVTSTTRVDNLNVATAGTADTATNVTGVVAIANGGTGASTRQNAMDALAGAVTSGQYLRGDGTDVVMSAIQAADIPTLNQSTTGNAATATALQTARTINGTSFNGTANITITATATNALTFGTYLTGTSYNGSGAVTLATNATNTNTVSTLVARDASGNFSAGTITAALSGNASTATTLATGRTINMTGDVVYTSGSFNGSADVTGTATLSNSGVTPGSYTNASINVDAKGRVTLASSGLASVPERASSLQTNATWFRNALRIQNPTGASYAFYTNQTGALKIKFPVASANANGFLISMTIKMIEFGTNNMKTIVVNGYAQSSFGIWHPSSSASIVETSLGGTAESVRFGRDATSYCLWLGTTSDTNAEILVAVTDVQIGGITTQITDANWGTGWSITNVTNFDTVDQNVTALSPYSTPLGQTTLNSSNYTSYSPSLTGSGASGTWGINITGSASNIAGGAQFSIPYNTSSGNTAFIPIGTSGQLLQSNGNSAPPSWVAPPVVLSKFSLQKLSINLSSATYWNTINYLSETLGIMCLGGRSTGGETLNAAYRFNPTNHERVNLSLPSGITSINTHASTRLLDGRIFVCGGAMNVYTNTAWIYSPTANTWITVANMPTAIKQHNAVTLNDGRVLVIGGTDSLGNYPTQFFIFTVDTNTWQSFANSNSVTRRRFAAAALLGDGRVFFAGGQDSNGNINGACFIFDPATNTFVTSGIPTLPRPLSDVGLCSMADGRVLAVGGRYTDSTFTAWDSSDSYIYSTTTNTWTKSTSLPYPVEFPRMTDIGNGQILVTSGLNNGYVSNGATPSAGVKEIFVFVPT